MTSPWHRSRLFWLGLAGLAALLWLWLGHLDTIVHLGWTTRRDEYRLRWGGGVAGFSVVGFHSWYYGGASVFSDRGTGIKTFREPAESFSTTNMAETTLPLAHITGIYATLWLGGLLLWQKRKHRLMTAPVLLDNPFRPQ